jgi:hypothetical protein
VGSGAEPAIRKSRQQVHRRDEDDQHRRDAGTSNPYGTQFHAVRSRYLGIIVGLAGSRTSTMPHTSRGLGGTMAGARCQYPMGPENSVTCFELRRRQKHRSDQTLPLNVFK